ncbi:MAG: DUF5659 domain-containing protein [bacterium]|nr:DUF5659 domain-containing protein [bacterium]
METRTKEIVDLGLTAALTTRGFLLLDIQPVDARRFAFIFSASEELEQEIQKYWNNTLTVPAQRYFDQIKVIKNRLYAQKQYGNK